MATNKVEDVRTVLQYYNEFDDPMAKFRENQVTVMVSLPYPRVFKYGMYGIRMFLLLLLLCFTYFCIRIFPHACIQ